MCGGFIVDGIVDPAIFDVKKAALLEERGAVADRIAGMARNPAWLAEKVRRYLELATRASLSYDEAPPHIQRDLLLETTSNRSISGWPVSILCHSFPHAHYQRAFDGGSQRHFGQ